jgi:hypothetical protein
MRPDLEHGELLAIGDAPESLVLPCRKNPYACFHECRT